MLSFKRDAENNKILNLKNDKKIYLNYTIIDSNHFLWFPFSLDVGKNKIKWKTEKYMKET